MMNFFQGIFGLKFRLKDNPVGFFKRIDSCFVKTAASKSLDIQAVELGAISRRVAKWRNIHGHHGTGPDNRPAADFDVLVNAHQPAQDNVIFDDDMPSQRRAVGNDVAIAKPAIMRDMAIHHQKVMIADPRDHSAARRARIERRILPNRIVIPYVQLARLSFVLQILRRRAHAGEWKDNIAFPQRCAPFDGYMGLDLGPLADLNSRSDDRVRPHLDLGIQFGAAIDDGGGMNFPHGSTNNAVNFYSLSISMAEISACATNLPSTVATPSIFQNVPRRFIQVISRRN